MALGGGEFTVMNKVLPGVYVNVRTGASSDSEYGKRGYLAIPMFLHWGEAGKVTTITAKTFESDSYKLIGYSSSSDEAKPFREMFKGATTLYVYRVSGGDKAAKAANANIGTALYEGIAGNNLKVVVKASLDEEGKFVVDTYMNGTKLDTQTVAKASDLKDNDFIKFAATALAANTYTFTGGADGTATLEAYTACEEAFQRYTFNALAVELADEDSIKTFVEFTKRMRDERGLKFQLVVHDYNSADYEGVVSVKNKPEGTTERDASFVYWVAGQTAGADAGESLTGTEYNGDYTINTDYTQLALEQNIRSGSFMFHEVNGVVRVLKDIDTLTTYTAEKGELFSDCSVIRTIDGITSDIAIAFATMVYGKLKNNGDGREIFRMAIIETLDSYAASQAIEGVDSEDITVSAVDGDKGAVTTTFSISVVGTIDKVYMTINLA